MILQFATVLLSLLSLSSSYAKDIPQVVASKDKNCFGGGVKFKSPLYTLNYQFSEFNLGHPTCELSDDYNKYGEEFSDRKTSIDKLINKIINNPECNDFSGLFKTFIKARDSVFEHIKEVTPRRKSVLDFHMERLMSDIHLEQAALSRDVNFCGSSDISTKFWPYWFILTKVKDILQNYTGSPSNSGPTIIKENGQAASSCENVHASGDADLENFYVTIPKTLNSDLIIDFDAYSIPDRIIVSKNDNIVFETKCTGGAATFTMKKEELTGTEKIKVEVKAKCDGSEGTFWEVAVNCKLKEPEPGLPPCVADLKKLETYLEQMMQTFKPMQDHYWMNVICYNEYDERLKTELPPPETYLEILEDDQCVGCTKRKIEKYAPSINLKDKVLPQVTNKDFKSTISREPKSIKNIEGTTQESSQVYFHKQRYFDNKELYCDMLKMLIESHSLIELVKDTA